MRLVRSVYGVDVGRSSEGQDLVIDGVSSAAVDVEAEIVEAREAKPSVAARQRADDCGAGGDGFGETV